MEKFIFDITEGILLIGGTIWFIFKVILIAIDEVKHGKAKK